MFNLTALLIAHCLFKFKYVNSLTIFALLSPLIFLTFGTNIKKLEIVIDEMVQCAH